MDVTLKTRCKNVLAAAAVAVASVLGCASAQAAVYVGSWDPAFGSSFPDLGWEGDVTFSVADSCVSGSSPTCSMSLISGSVDLYALATPTTRQTLSFDSTNFPLPSQFATATVVSHQVTGISGLFLIPEVTTFGPGGVTHPTSFWLSFSAMGPQLLFSYWEPSGSFWKPPSLITGSSDFPTDNGLPTGKAVPLAFTTIHVVPEPGSLALALVGLGGLLAARRRKQSITR